MVGRSASRVLGRCPVLKDFKRTVEASNIVALDYLGFQVLGPLILRFLVVEVLPSCKDLLSSEHIRKWAVTGLHPPKCGVCFMV